MPIRRFIRSAWSAWRCSRTCRAGRASPRRPAGRSTAVATAGFPGKGRASSILEEEQHAKNRGAKIYGEFLGGGSGCDAMPAGGLDPEGSGTEVAITAALEEAGIDARREIGHVNAHGSATKRL